MASLVSLVDQARPYLFPYLPECPDGIMHQQLYKAAKDFCMRTQLWVETLTLNIEKGEQQYYFLNQVNDNAEWHQIFDIQKTNEIDDLTTVTLAQQQATKYFVNMDYNIIRDENDVQYVFLLSKPNRTLKNALHIRNVLMPDQNQMLMPEWILKDWLEGIAYGAQARLKSMPNVGWTDPQGAMFANQQYVTTVNQAIILRNKMYANGEIRMKIPLAPRYNRKGLWGLNGIGQESVNV